MANLKADGTPFIHDWVLWAFTPRWQGPNGTVQPLKVAAGTMKEMRTRQRSFHDDYRDGQSSIYRSGDAPVGLRAQCKAAGY